ncbi:MAG: DUF2877 domain-containing protein [Cupriavidus sp.]|nr:DUF2877 domain-containing protein [Cupriavidus sp.]
MRILSIGADLRMDVGRTMRGHVQCRFEHAAHLKLDDGRLLTLLGSEAQRGMRVINVAGLDWPELRQSLAPGDAVSLSAVALKHARFTLPIHGVDVWQAPDIAGSFAGIALSDQRARLQICVAAMTTYLDTLSATTSAPTYRLWQAALAAFARVTESVRACGDTDAIDVSLDRAVGAALGLGPGLTPSADDMIAGMLTGFLAAQASGARASKLAQCVQRHWHGTSIASRDGLAQAMHGWTTSRMADVCAALTRTSHTPTSPTSTLRDALDAQVAVGRHSGLDTLVGFLTGLGLGADLAGQTSSVIFPHADLGRRCAPIQERMFA